MLFAHGQLALQLFWVALWLGLACAQNGHLEVAQASIYTAAYRWQYFSFKREFPDVPVVMVMPDTGTLGYASAASDDPFTIRLRNVGTTGFEASAAEPSGSGDGSGGVGSTLFNYMAASVGVWQLNGAILEAGRIETSERRGASCRPLTFPNEGWTEIRFLHAFEEEPAILLAIQTSENEARDLESSTGPSVPWLTVSARNANNNSIEVTLDSSKAAGTGSSSLTPETIGYVAVENVGASDFEVPGWFLENELMHSHYRCEPNTWTDIFSDDGAEGCRREFLTRADCSQQYLNLNSDGSCGCISVGTNCSGSNLYYSSEKLYRVQSAEDCGGLSVVTGCPTISDKATCLSSIDGRALSSWTASGARCVWCGSECVAGTGQPCEPLDYLLSLGLFDESFEVSECSSSGSSTVAFLTQKSEVSGSSDFAGINWVALGSWPSVSLASGLQSSAPLVLASINTNRQAEGGWLRLRYVAVSALSVQFLLEEPYKGVSNAVYQQQISSDLLEASFGTAGGTESFDLASVDITDFIYTNSAGWVFKDDTMLEILLNCAQEECLDSLRFVGANGGFFTVTDIASLYTVSVGKWQTITLSLTDESHVSYGTDVPWILSSLDILSSVGGLEFDVWNLKLKISREWCLATRDQEAEEVSIVAFDESFHVELSSATSTSTTGSSTSTSISTSSTSSSSSVSSSSSSSTSLTSTLSSSSSTSTTSSSSSSTSTSSTSTTSSSGSSTSTTSSSSSSTRTTSSSSSSSRTSSTSTRTTSSSASTSSTSTSRSSLTSTATISSSSISMSSSSLSSSLSSTWRTRTSTSSAAAASSPLSSTTSSTHSSPTVMASSTSRTTSVTETSQATLEMEIFLELEQAREALLSDLLSNHTMLASVVSASPLGTMTATRLPNILEENASDFVFVILEESPAGAILPAEVMELAPGTALVTTSFEGNHTMALGAGTTSTSEGHSWMSVVDAVDVSLINLGDFTSVKVTVATPIYVRLSDAVTPNASLRCAFLDGDTWSQEGIRLASQEELREFFGENMTGLWCATTHLSIFGAFLDLLLDCTNVNVLSRDGLEEILRNPWWFRRPPALLLWLLLVVLICFMVAGALQDQKLYGSGMWTDEYFLTELPPVSRSCSLSRIFARCATKPRELLPEMSFEKSFLHLEDLNDWMEKQDLYPKLSDKMSQFILCQNTLREVALQHSVHPSFMVGHIWGPNGWVQGSLAVAKSKKLSKLIYELEEWLPKAFVKIHSSRARRALSTCLAAHPVLELWQWNLHITAAKRAKIIADCVLGSLTFVALFFSVDGTAVAARSPANCPVQQGTFLWYAFVAIVSILLNLIPRGIITYMAYRGFVQESRHRRWQLRLFKIKDACFWTLGATITFVQLLVIMAFLANLSEVDEWKWMISFGVVLVRKMLVVPILACVFASLGTELAAWSQPNIVSKPPKKLELDMDLVQGKAIEETAEMSLTWTRKVEELAERGITIRQLLDFYASLGGTLMPHFDPDSSTTHDVVRQAIIPGSLQFRSWRSFMVVVHEGQNLAAMDFFSSDPYCVVQCVAAMSNMPKPWKGGGRTATAKKTLNPTWEEAFLLHELAEDELLHLSIWDEDVLTKDDALGQLCLAASDFWDGLHRNLELQGPGSTNPTLRISVTSYADSASACAALDSFNSVCSEGVAVSHAGEASQSPSSNAASEGYQFYDAGDHVPIVVNHGELNRCAIVASKGVFERDHGGHGSDLHVGISIDELMAPMEAACCASSGSQPSVAGYAYASCVNMGRPQLGKKMVTHSWRNKFSFLMASILADALGSTLYDSVVQMLKHQQFGELCEKLKRCGKLDVAYWVCAFSVNQHAGICATPPAQDSTGHDIVPCGCDTAKEFQGDLSEMNKFDHMMALLKHRLRRDFCDVRLEQVVAMEPDFSLLTRMWCIAELVEARKLHLQQSVMIHSAASRHECLQRLFALDVREADASFPADKELILGKITDIDAFNRQLQDLILHRLDTFLETNSSRLAATVLDEILLAVATVVV